MSQFIETLCIKDKKAQLVDLHQKRFDKTRSQFFGPELPSILLRSLLDFPKLTHQKYKVRIKYSKVIEGVSLVPYYTKPIHSLSVVFADEVDYSFKFCNRTSLDQLLAKGESDDVIICKNGYVTDGHYSNLVFENKDGFFTSKTPLLTGIKREFLLRTNQIKERSISIENIFDFDRVHFINAMLDIGERHMGINKNLRFVK